jgi:hypothetical protein
MQENTQNPIKYNSENEDDGVQGAMELLSQTTWKTEALQIPLESLQDEQEQVIIIKCINEEPLTDEEMTQLQTILHRYRPAIQKHKPLESIENYHDNIEYVEDEKAFLQLLDEEKKEQTLTMYYPLMDGREARLNLTVKPVTDAQAIMDVSENLNLFKDYTQEELQAFNKYNQGEHVTPEEKAIAEKVQQEIAQANANTIQDTAIEFLALQTSFTGKNSSYEDMKAIYSQMHVGYLLLLFARVREIAHIDDVDTEKIFRQSD